MLSLTNTTDLLQPVNEPAKDFLKHMFEVLYSIEVIKQLEGVRQLKFNQSVPARLPLRS